MAAGSASATVTTLPPRSGPGARGRPRWPREPGRGGMSRYGRPADRRSARQRALRHCRRSEQPAPSEPRSVDREGQLLHENPPKFVTRLPSTRCPGNRGRYTFFLPLYPPMMLLPPEPYIIVGSQLSWLSRCSSNCISFFPAEVRPRPLFGSSSALFSLFGHFASMWLLALQILHLRWITWSLGRVD